MTQRPVAQPVPGHCRSSRNNRALVAAAVGTNKSNRAARYSQQRHRSAHARAAITAAPENLFVSGAGNSNASNQFNEFIPASFDLPNTITVGAVDQAGDETAFTSFGPRSPRCP